MDAIKRRLSAALLWLPVLLIGAPTAYYEVFSRFAILDDEGFLLQSLFFFGNGRALYDDVFSQYGPFYYLLFGGFFKLFGISITLDSGRLVVIALWLLGATLGGIAVRRITGSALIGVIAQVVCFGVLSLAAFEPMHPEVLASLLLLAIILAIGTQMTGDDLPSRASAVTVGVLVGLLTMTKINLGLLAGVALLGAASLTLPHAASCRRWRIGTLAVLLGLPVLLLGRDLDQEQIQSLLLLVLGGLAAVLLVLRPGGGSGARAAEVAWLGALVGAALGACLLVASITVGLGTSPGELFSAIVTRPSDLRLAFWAPVDQRDFVVVAVIAAVAIAWVLRGREKLNPTPDGLLVAAGVRIAAALATLIAVLAEDPLGLGKSGRVVIPVLFAWIAVLPPPLKAPRGPSQLVRASVVLLAILEVLQVYPVAGTQLRVAALSFVAVAAIVLCDGLAALREARSPRLAKVGADRLAIGVLAGSLALLAVLALGRPLNDARGDYRRGDTVAAAGAGRLRLPPVRAAEYSQIDAAIGANCRALITLPGTASFNLWTQLRPPDGFNASDWMYLLDEREQGAIVASLRPARRICLLVNYSTLTVWRSTTRLGPLPRRAELRYIEAGPWTELSRAPTQSLVLYRRAAVKGQVPATVVPAGY